MSLRVLKPGFLTTVQDLGRSGFQRYGVVVGGAADPFAARVMNALVGNEEGAAVLEIALAGPQLQFETESLVAWCGADFDAVLGDVPLPKNRPVRVPAGSMIDFRGARQGTSAWLAVSGGIAVPPVMGSRTTHVASGIGGRDGRALLAGDELAFGTVSPWSLKMLEHLRASGKTVSWSIPPERFGKPNPRGLLRIIRGPEWDWFSEESRSAFFRRVYETTKDGNRMGTRLTGPKLLLIQPREMISTAVDHGVIQVPPSGEAILLGADRQTLGGYPRIGAVATIDFGELAQLCPGDPVRFDEIAIGRAHELLIQRERDFTIARLHLANFTC